MPIMKEGHCSLGLRRILDDSEPVGHIIYLRKLMWLGRMPSAMNRAMKKHKSPTSTWSARDIRMFRKHCPEFQQYAIMSLDMDVTDTATTIEDNTKCQNNNEKNSLQQKNNHALRELHSISRHLLMVVAATHDSLTLERCGHSTGEPGRKVREVSVTVFRRDKRKEAISLNTTGLPQTKWTACNSTDDSTYIERVEPLEKVILEEGDTLTILNSNFRYQVIKAYAPLPRVNDLPKTSTVDAIDKSIIETRVSDEDLRPCSINYDQKVDLSGRKIIDPEVEVEECSHREFTGETDAGTLSDEEVGKTNEEGMDLIQTRFGKRNYACKKLCIRRSRPVSKVSNKPKAKRRRTYGEMLTTRRNDCGLICKSDKYRMNVTTDTLKFNDCRISTTDRQKRKKSVDIEPHRTSAAQTVSYAVNTKKVNRNKKIIAKGIVTPLSHKTSSKAKHLPRHTQGESHIVTRVNPTRKTGPMNDRSRQSVPLINTKQLNLAISEASTSTQYHIWNPKHVKPLTWKFWDPSWKTRSKRRVEVNVNQTRSTDSQNATSSTIASTIQPYGCDIRLSLARLYWKSLNSSRPYDGALFLNGAAASVGRVPSISVCTQWMELLTWGYRLQFPTSEIIFPMWDGPKMDYSFGVWKNIVHRYPSILLNRMISCAPGGPLKWWKTCLHHLDIWVEVPKGSNRNTFNSIKEWLPPKNTTTPGEEEQGAIDMLRLRSSRLDVLLFLMKNNLDLERRLATQQNAFDATNSGCSGPADEESSSSDSSSDDERPKKLPTARQSSVFLSTVRGCGHQTVLKDISQALARFWLTHKEYLGWYKTTNHHVSFLWQQHSDVVSRIASQLVKVLKYARITFGNHFISSCATFSREDVQQQIDCRAKLTDEVFSEIVWSVMSTEMSKHKAILTEHKYGRNKHEKSIKWDTVVVQWILIFYNEMGEGMVELLSKLAGVADEFGAIMEQMGQRM